MIWKIKVRCGHVSSTDRRSSGPVAKQATELPKYMDPSERRRTRGPIRPFVARWIMRHIGPRGIWWPRQSILEASYVAGRRTSTISARRTIPTTKVPGDSRTAGLSGNIPAGDTRIMLIIIKVFTTSRCYGAILGVSFSEISRFPTPPKILECYWIINRDTQWQGSSSCEKCGRQGLQMPTRSTTVPVRREYQKGKHSA